MRIKPKYYPDDTAVGGTSKVLLRRCVVAASTRGPNDFAVGPFVCSVKSFPSAHAMNGIKDCDTCHFFAKYLALQGEGMNVKKENKK